MKAAQGLKRECVCSKPNIMPSGLFICLEVIQIKEGNKGGGRGRRRQHAAMIGYAPNTVLRCENYFIIIFHSLFFNFMFFLFHGYLHLYLIFLPKPRCLSSSCAYTIFMKNKETIHFVRDGGLMQGKSFL